MNCPKCDVKMIGGVLQSKTSFFSTAMPTSYDDQNWYFIAADGRKQRLNASMHKRHVLRCETCGLIAVPTHV